MGNELRFDWFPVIESKELKALAQELAKDVIATYRPERGKRAEDRANKVMVICRQLISALYSSHVAPYSSSSISFPRRTGSYHRTKPRKVRLSYKYSIKVFDSLQSSGWVEVTKDGHDRSYTRIACSVRRQSMKASSARAPSSLKEVQTAHPGSGRCRPRHGGLSRRWPPPVRRAWHWREHSTRQQWRT